MFDPQLWYGEASVAQVNGTGAAAVAARLGRLFLIGIPGPSVDAVTRELLTTVRPGFVILFDRNIESPDQLRRLGDEIHAVLGYRPVIAIDQEGGVVTRLRHGFTVSPGARATAEAVGTGGADGTEGDLGERVAEIMAREMAEVGIRWNLAPVADINNNHANPGIGIRSFGETPDAVIPHAAAFLRGTERGGAAGCLKHFPGMGRVAVDPHVDMPVLEVDHDELWETELRPFREIDCPAWMPTHVYVPALQSSREPITVSREVLTDMVRGTLGYEGLLVADDLTMGGVAGRYGPEEAIERTLTAGMDVLSVCHDPDVQIRQYHHLLKRVTEDQRLAVRLDESYARVCRFVETIGRKEAVATDCPTIGRKEAAAPHRSAIDPERRRAFMTQVARRAVTVLRMDGAVPSRPEMIVAPRLTRRVLVEDEKSGVPDVARRLASRWKVPLLPCDRKSIAGAATGRSILVFTENAHLDRGTSALITELCGAARAHLVVALRNPYDAEIPTVGNVVASYGYTGPQQDALEGFLLDWFASEEE